MGLLRRCVTTVAAVMVVGAVGAPPVQALPVNSAPVALPDTAGVVVVNTQVVIDPRANDSDVDGGALTVIGAVLQSGAASVALDPATQLVAITPTAVGQVVVGYTITDGVGATASSTISVEAVDPPPPPPPPNQAPVAGPDAAQMYSGGELRLDPRGNDSDPDGEVLAVTSAVLSSGTGTVAIEGQELVIRATAGFLGPLVVTYVVSDPRGQQAQSTVTVDVIRAPNRPPVAVGDAVIVKTGRTYRIAVLANDSDPDGDRLTLAKVGKAKHGTAKRSGSKVVYRAPKSWVGRATVRYTVRDASGVTTTGVLTITVARRTPKPTPKPQPPAAGDGASRADVERALGRLGLPTGRVNGSYDAATRRAVCAWRTITGRTASRALPSAAEARAIVATSGLPSAGSRMVAGVNISVTCQSAFWVGSDRGYRRVMAASTGKPGYRTRLGTHRIFRTHHVWRFSTIYPEARMYKPMQFSGGQAMHGSATDQLVKTYPASHGCVRMLHRDIDAMQAGGVGNGTRVRVFGTW